MAYRSNGPRAGRSTGRMRNTLVNLASKKLGVLGVTHSPLDPEQGPPPQTGGGDKPDNGGKPGPGGGGKPAPGIFVPPVGPQSSVAYSGQLAMLQATLAERLAAIRAGKGLIQGQFRMDRAAARTLGIEGVSGAVNQALDRGIIGSSTDLEQRAAALAAKQQALQQAQQQKLMGLLGLRQDRISAMNEYFSGIFGVQAAKAAEQAALANADLASDTTPNGTGTSPDSSSYAWGGYSNGQIPASALERVSYGNSSALAAPQMIPALDALVKAARADGVRVAFSGIYRPLSGQVAGDQWDDEHGTSRYAEPGTSVHGWGLAIDFNNEDDELIAWLQAHAAEYGFSGISNERWHYQFNGWTPPTTSPGGGGGKRVQ